MLFVVQIAQSKTKQSCSSVMTIEQEFEEFDLKSGKSAYPVTI